ncbi:hypothetical protein EDC39_11132 [Geothermobacter ehrlichii]|uniref:Uncharacterized protein n=1 Tax=Geothermobacter ehrlichii TaxID=213224 RepID=A0A5D3WH49_9BACT|nr:hypothetical protein [Geothermobacter ehrlichii]TYO97103.1 hypothetical protein EDC39_11132 [Geothermobacter ehrlichii]
MLVTLVYAATAALLNARHVLRILELRQTAITKRIAWLQQQIQTPAELDAWCADLTTNLTGDVGTCEVGRGSTAIIIRPGLEKWRPRYRTGTIHNIDPNTGTCDVILNGEIQSGDDYNYTYLPADRQNMLASGDYQGDYATDGTYSYTSSETRADYPITGTHYFNGCLDVTSADDNTTSSGTATLLDGATLSAQQDHVAQETDIVWDHETISVASSTYTESWTGTYYLASHYLGTQVIVNADIGTGYRGGRDYYRTFNVTSVRIRTTSPLKTAGDPASHFDYDYANGDPLTDVQAVIDFLNGFDTDLTSTGIYVADRA